MNLWKGSTVVLVAALTYVVNAGSNAGSISTAQAGPQSEMKIALGHLEQAKLALERSIVDKGGHRLRAIELTEDAIAQIRKVENDEH